MKIDLIDLANRCYRSHFDAIQARFGDAEPLDIAESVIDGIGEHYFVYLKVSVSGADVTFSYP